MVSRLARSVIRPILTRLARFRLSPCRVKFYPDFRASLSEHYVMPYFCSEMIVTDPIRPATTEKVRD